MIIKFLQEVPFRKTNFSLSYVCILQVRDYLF